MIFSLKKNKKIISKAVKYSSFRTIQNKRSIKHNIKRFTETARYETDISF